ncbi:hypothetical protein KI387_017171 [Taxus chinensis]|uniref:Uncharacterized protein n=1 Tax=Taxus chinensis TaxID=29808 RepID=A0AA38GI78_TAXCH|nr:hypothetical protein KI387_017171 [Taxus chinensis]
MRGVLKEVVAEIGDTMVDSEDEAMVVEEVSFLTEHVIHMDLLTTIGVNVLKILHVLSMERTIAMKSAQTYMSI